MARKVTSACLLLAAWAILDWGAGAETSLLTVQGWCALTALTLYYVGMTLWVEPVVRQ